MKTNQEKYDLSEQKVSEEKKHSNESLETNEEADRNIEFERWRDECVNARMWNNLKKGFMINRMD